MTSEPKASTTTTPSLVTMKPLLTEKTELWRRWRHGESLNAIGRALGRIAKVVRYEVARTGGIPPPARQRSRLALTLPEREAISRGLASGTSVRQISRQLRRAPSTVSREVRRHGGRRRYRAATADAATWARGRRPKRCRLATYPALRTAVATKLAQKWSPQQIAGWLRQAYPDDPTMHVSHETIYLTGISDLLAPDGTFIHPRAAERTKFCSAHNRPAPEAVTSAHADVEPTGAAAFRAFLRHRSTLVPFLRQPSLHSAARQPAGTGSAQILRSISPKSRRFR